MYMTIAAARFTLIDLRSSGLPNLNFLNLKIYQSSFKTPLGKTTLPSQPHNFKMSQSQPKYQGCCMLYFDDTTNTVREMDINGHVVSYTELGNIPSNQAWAIYVNMTKVFLAKWHANNPP